MVWNFISKLRGQKKKIVRKKNKRKINNPNNKRKKISVTKKRSIQTKRVTKKNVVKKRSVKTKRIAKRNVTKKRRIKTKRVTKTKKQINIKKQLAKLNKEVDAFSKATHKFLGSALNYAALHPNGIKKIEKHVLYAAQNLEELKKINKK